LSLEYEPFNPDTFADACEYIANHCKEIESVKLMHDKGTLLQSLKCLSVFIDDLVGIVRVAALDQISKIIEDTRLIVVSIDPANWSRVLPRVESNLMAIRKVVRAR